MTTNNSWNTGTIITVPQGGTSISSTTAYGTLCGGTTSTGAWQTVNPGVSGQILKSRGSGFLPWYASASGSLQLLSHQVASSSSSISFTSLITTTYKNYMIIIGDVSPSVTGNLIMTWSVDNGSNYLSSNYESGNRGTSYNSTTGNNNNSTVQVNIGKGGSVLTTDYISGVFYLFNLKTSLNPYIIGQTFTTVTLGDSLQHMVGAYNTTSTGVNAIKFAFSLGNIAAGYFTLYGIEE